MNKELNSIQAPIFQKHIQATHLNVTCDEMPPEHTLIIEGNITSSISNTTQQRIDRHLRHQVVHTPKVMNRQTFRTLHNNKLRGCKRNDGQ